MNTSSVSAGGGFANRSRSRRIGSGLLQFSRRHPTGAIGAVVLVTIAILVLFANFIAPFRYDRTISAMVQAPMSEAQGGGTMFLGSDELGRDIVTRLLHGGRTSLLVGISAPLIGVTLGTILGIASAHYGRWFDLLSQRLVDTLLVLPGLVLAMAITVAFGFTTLVVIIALAVNVVAGTARTVRSHALTLTQMQYVDAARSTGVSNWGIILRHLLPNSMAVSIVLFTVSMGSAITAEAALSFLGLGIQPPTPSWGNMLSNAQTFFDLGPHIAIAPGATITVAVLAINLFGDSLRDVLDPRMRGRR